ncbi:MAG: metallophosphatase family protein [Bacteroidales bacterium]|nr:metallophosphatase family protein [Bacteroidales bacterium]
MKIGLISDTHGYLDPRLFELFADCDEIWHSGDIGSIDVLNALRRFKPTRAVYGNIDGGEVRFSTPAVERFEVGGMDIMMMHIGGYPGNYSPQALSEMMKKPPQIFVAGHSHILKVIYDKKYNCLHLNPGACGRYGFHLVRTALRFEIADGEVRNMEVIELGKRK